jgi:hypothetical protein
MTTAYAQAVKESVLHRLVADYVRLKYPDVIFNSDGAGNNLSRTQAAMSSMLRSSAGFPDLQLCIPKGEYHGFFLELKRDGTAVRLKNGELTADRHIREQYHMLERLCQAGYFADFGIGYEDATSKVDYYMGL